MNFVKFLRTPFVTEHHWTTASRLVINFSDLVPEAAIKRAVPKNLTIFAVRQLRWSLFLIKLQAFRSVTLLKRDSNTGVPVNIAKFFVKLILKIICQQLLVWLSIKRFSDCLFHLGEHEKL